MRLSIVAAMSRNGVIGRAGGIPWRLPDEQKALKALTMGHCLLMGRKTWDSIGRALPGRTSVVITRDPSFAVDHEDVVVVDSLDAAIEAARARGDDEAFVFGGAEIYAQALPRADRLYLTRVEAEIEGEVRFPDLPEHEWRCLSEERHEPDERHAHAWVARVLERVEKP